MDAAMVKGIGDNYVEEVSSETLYRTLAGRDKKEDRSKLLLALAGYERKHAELWANVLRQNGLPLPAGRTIAKHRVYLALARAFGVGSVLSTIHRDEVDGIKKYTAQAAAWNDPVVQEAFGAILPDEISHEIDTLGEARDAAREGGALRSAVLGANDGIGSLLALSAGVAAATASGLAVLVAGAAALVAGSISMAASNYVSVKAEEEMYARIREQERGGIDVDRAAKVRQLEAAYQKRGFTEAEAAGIVRRLATDDEEFTRALLTERHGIGEASFSNPFRLGIITGAAFLLAGLVPLLPFFLLPETSAILAAVVASAVVLFSTGVFRSMSTLTSLTRGGLEMLGIGLGSAGLTYGIGLVIAGAVH